MSRKIILEDLFEDIRSLSEQYELDENEPDVIILKTSEFNAFTADMIRTMKDFLEKELALSEEEEEDEDELDEDEFQEIFWLDDDGELE